MDRNTEFGAASINAMLTGTLSVAFLLTAEAFEASIVYTVVPCVAVCELGLVLFYRRGSIIYSLFRVAAR